MLYNKVQKHTRSCRYYSTLSSQARVVVGHGQMEGDKLEDNLMSLLKENMTFW